MGTASSESAIVPLMQKLERLGCSKSVVGLVVPSGYSFNLDGTNIYLTMAAIFVAQALNIDLTLRQQLTILAVAMLTSKGASGVTGAGFITLAATLAVVPSIPVAGLALILGIDRFMSEARSITNFIGNGVATVVISNWERELDRKKLLDTLKGPQRMRSGMPSGGGTLRKILSWSVPASQARAFPSSHHREEGRLRRQELRRQENVAKPPYGRSRGGVPPVADRNTTPAALKADAAQYCFTRSATPPRGDAEEGTISAISDFCRLCFYSSCS